MFSEGEDFIKMAGSGMFGSDGGNGLYGYNADNQVKVLSGLYPPSVAEQPQVSNALITDCATTVQTPFWYMVLTPHQLNQKKLTQSGVFVPRLIKSTGRRNLETLVKLIFH